MNWTILIVVLRNRFHVLSIQISDFCLLFHPVRGPGIFRGSTPVISYPLLPVIEVFNSGEKTILFLGLIMLFSHSLQVSIDSGSF